MSSTTRPTLLKRLGDGADPLAWDEFFDRYWRLIYAFARRRGCSDHTAEEVVQEVMLAVFQQQDVFSYDPARGRFRDWLGAVVRKPNYRGISATFWRNLAMVGDDSTFTVMGTPNCGKGEPNQTMRVGHASPACVFTEVDVFGGE